MIIINEPTIIIIPYTMAKADYFNQKAVANEEIEILDYKYKIMSIECGLGLNQGFIKLVLSPSGYDDFYALKDNENDR